MSSLYRDPPFDGDADACACGHSDPLHVHDAEMGFVRADGVEALRFSGRTVVGGELSALSCDAAKARAVTGPLAWQHDVDAFTSPSARRGPPPRGYNSSHGQGASLAFEDWLAAKAERALQQEARRKRQAVAELCTQVARRAQAQQAFQQWSAEKAAAAATAPGQPALSHADETASDAETEARRDAMLQLCGVRVPPLSSCLCPSLPSARSPCPLADLDCASFVFSSCSASDQTAPRVEE